MDRTPHATRRLASHLASVLPPPLRRAISGLWLDALGLPERLADPARRAEPWQALHNVGGGDYALAGRELLQQLVAYADLQADGAVLDIGCGTGRLAAPLAGFLSPRGGYIGFDVARRAITACRRRVGRERPDFRFVEADVANREYRAGGRQAEAAYRFPAEDAAIDVAVATSVFSHMQLASIRHYLAETHRTLKPGGRVMFTAYALTGSRPWSVGRACSASHHGGTAPGWSTPPPPSARSPIRWRRWRPRCATPAWNRSGRSASASGSPPQTTAGARDT